MVCFLLWLTWFIAIYLAWPMSLVWLAVPIAWLVSLALSYGWINVWDLETACHLKSYFDSYLAVRAAN